MSNTTIINRIIDDGSIERKEIFELEENDVHQYRLLGQSTGINMDHCVILGTNHKDDFWHRVYGYRIIQNEEREKQLLEAMRKIKPEVESYMTVCFYERYAAQKFMFVPSRLEIPDRPELHNFPLNIVFGTVCVADNNTQRMETSEYAPDISTFKEEGDEQKMRYYNNLNNKFWVEIVYNANKQSYIGTKYCGSKNIGMAVGKNWNMFFVHLTALGVGSGLDIPD